MTRVRILLNRFFAIIRKRDLDGELEREIQSHIELQTEDNLRRGMSAADARLAALRSFGGVEQTKERYRELRGVPFLESVYQDIRFAARMLAKNRAFTLVAVGAVALGIGLNTAMFSVVNAVLLRSLPYKDSEQLVWIWSVNERTGLKQRVSYPDFLDWRAEAQSFEALVGWNEYQPVLTGIGEPERLRAELTLGNFFTVLGVSPALGTTAEADRDRTGDPGVVLSNKLWQRAFNRDPNVIGRRIALDGIGYTVAAVMPAGFQFPIQSQHVDAWVRVERFNPALASRREARLIEVMARLKPHLTPAQAQAEMDRIASALSHEYPETNGAIRAGVEPALDEIVGDSRLRLLALFGAVACVLSIACVNTANVQLAGAAARRGELAVRTAIGAGRRRIARQLIIESLLVAAAGGTIGSAVAFWSLTGLKNLVPAGIPRIAEISIDFRVLGFTILVSVGAGLIFGIAPAWYLFTIDSSEPLSGIRAASNHRNATAVGAILVVGEIAIATLLLTCAGLFAKSFWRLIQIDSGFDPRRVLAVGITLPSAKYPHPDQAFQEIQHRLRGIPGVRSASMGFQLPDRGAPISSDISPFFEIVGRPAVADSRPRASLLIIQPDYFRTLGIPLLRGRDFTEADRLFSPRVIVVNESLARMYFPGEDPIGKRLKLDSWVLSGQPEPEIIGIAGDVKNRDVDVARPLVYAAISQFPRWNATLILKTTGEPLQYAGAVRDAIRSFDKDQPIDKVETFEERIATSVAADRFNAFLVGLFSLAGLTLAAAGLYGVLSYTIARQTKDIGIRIALGAERGAVVRMIIRHGVNAALAGIAIGIGGALALTRLISGLFFHVSARDPATVLAAALVLLITAVAASWIPARRAARVDPMAALRHE